MAGFWLYRNGEKHQHYERKCDADNNFFLFNLADRLAGNDVEWEIRAEQITDVNELGLVNTHPPESCAGQMACPIHDPSDHHMRDWVVIWRSDRGILERICPCGIGHPDPDQFPFWETTNQMAQAVHGCCGHCHP